MERALVVSALVLVATLTQQHSNATTASDDVNYETASQSSAVLENIAEVTNSNDLIGEATEEPRRLGELYRHVFGEEIADWDIGAYDPWWYIRTIPVPLNLRIDMLQSIIDDLNDHCSEYLQPHIEDLRVELSDTECVKTRLVKWLTAKLTETFAVGHKNIFRECLIIHLRICSSDKLNCTLAFGDRAVALLGNFTEDLYDAKSLTGVTPLRIIKEYLDESRVLLDLIFFSPNSFLSSIMYYIITAPSIHYSDSKFKIPPWINNVHPTSFLHNDNFSMSHDKFTWGVVRSNTGSFKLPCSSYRDSGNSSQFLEYLKTCTSLRLARHVTDFLRCRNSDKTLRLVTWSTTPSLYFNSQCLCVAFNGINCGVKSPSSVEPRHYCLYVLLRDFQRQVSHRPAVTYLDYALQTRVSVCKFSNLLAVAFSSICYDTAENKTFDTVFTVKCLFKDLVNTELNCTRTLPVNPLNLTELCLAKFFTQLVVCDDDAGDEVRVPYYAAGDSTLVRVLTCVDVVVRVFTLVTYLACPQLRNLPGKLFIAYLTTALLRLVLVRATAGDLPLAVRLDVVLDLACTLCLTAYNHFLTSSFKALRPPDSLTREDVRQVLLRSALLGWVLPLVLSAAFFGVDEALDSPVQIGQLLFLLCDYVALLYNLYLFHGAYKCYHDIRKDAQFLRRDEKARGVYADLFMFALKTSLLSGAGIIFRLVFTQIQGLEHVLGYYHALGTLQGLLIFLLYGCNREARVFWLGVGSNTLRRCQWRDDSSSLRPDVMEMAPIRHRVQL